MLEELLNSPNLRAACARKHPPGWCVVKVDDRPEHYVGIDDSVASGPCETGWRPSAPAGAIRLRNAFRVMCVSDYDPRRFDVALASGRIGPSSIEVSPRIGLILLYNVAHVLSCAVSEWVFEQLSQPLHMDTDPTTGKPWDQDSYPIVLGLMTGRAPEKDSR